ncbi:hypothetical protein BG011_002059 [Mortierella polycephala]|uniref:Uncharacterized protein n=1 Tax=Mortierella polycephala TaxID=41804 RepID=A0A9P6U5N0_9FUNG|nr:hypothetical protein BG011_002059 [Mortierella polycephala]
MDASSQQQQIFEKFENYDFNNDATFQTGLKSIVGNHQQKSEKEQHEAIQNAKFFYFSRFVQNFDYNQYQAWRAQNAAAANDGSSAEGSKNQGTDGSTSQASNDNTTHSSVAVEDTSVASSSDPAYPKSFQEICELIASGKPIPGIRQIPNNLAEGTPSEAKLAPKPKPWEKKATEVEAAVAESVPATADA